MGRGKAYLGEEDIGLCRVWIRVADEGVSGSSRKINLFYTAVLAVFRELAPAGEAGTAAGLWGSRDAASLRRR